MQASEPTRVRAEQTPSLTAILLLWWQGRRDDALELADRVGRNHDAEVRANRERRDRNAV